MDGLAVLQSRFRIAVPHVALDATPTCVRQISRIVGGDVYEPKNMRLDILRILLIAVGLQCWTLRPLYELRRQ